jgi:quercetin dioxygenase-like cupin family protein
MQHVAPDRATDFATFELRTGLLFDGSTAEFPTILYAWREPDALNLENGTGDALFGYVHEGPAELAATHNSYRLVTGQYFCISEVVTISGGAGIVVRRVGFHGQNCLGGPIERVGRLRYINGCTDSLLVSPVKFGNPCLNALLYFPPGTDQSPHTHPSLRIGLTAAGRGECVGPNGVQPLVPGQAFVILAEAVHSFRTSESEMVVIAYHPDSDFGPQDENHPMINRTMVDGVSASVLDDIRTR